MAENGIESCADLSAGVRYYELASNLSAAGSARAGWCWQARKGVPIDFTVAAEFFKKAADSKDGCSANSFDCCLECGKGVDEDMELTVRFIARQYLSPIGTECITLCVASNTAKALAETSFVLRNTIVDLLK
jgi:hypothetical protein